MKKIFSLAVVLTLMSAFAAQAQQATYDVKSSSNTSLNLTLNPSSLEVQTVAFASDTFNCIAMSDFGSSYDFGRPNLPVMTKMIEIPVGASVRVRVTSETHKTYSSAELGIKYRYLPAQPSRRKSDTSTPSLVIDQQTYATDAFYSQELVSVENIGIARDRNLAALKFAPVQYNPVTGEVIVYQNVQVSLEFEGADLNATQQLKRLYGTPAFGAGISTINSLPATKDLNVNAPVRYTILAHSSFRGQLDEFVAWKKRKGFNVDVHYTGESGVGTTNATIKTFLKSLYTNATAESPAPTYVLLVGDVAQIPANAGQSTMQSDWGNYSSRVSDLYYFTWTNGDVIPDCYYGRFSAQTVAQLTPQIEKTLFYEQYSFIDPSYLTKGLLIAGTDQGNSSDNGYRCADPTMDYIASNYVNGNHGFSSVKYYKNNSSSNPNASNVTVYANGGYSAASSSHSVSVSVKNDINSGYGWINYSAHGNWNEWSIPSFTNTQVSNMTNTKKYGVMIGNCCLTNSFQQSECFGEALLRKGNYQGAVAYIGASDYTYWDQDYYWGVGYRSSVSQSTNYNSTRLGAYDRMFHTHNESFDKWATTTGALMYAGNMAVQAAGNSTYSHYYWEVYHLMGDPSVQPYLGQASTMAPTFIETVPMLMESFSVTAPAYAYVAITRDGELVDARFADANGHVDFPMSLLTIGDYELAITAQNYRPYFHAFSVTPGEGPYVLTTQLQQSAALEPGTRVNLTAVINNMGPDQADNLDIYLKSDDNLVTLVRSNGHLSSYASGAEMELTNVFSIVVSPAAKDQTECHFAVVTKWGATDSAVAHFVMPIVAPAYSVSVNAPAVVNAPAGFTISVTATNNGHMDATNLVSDIVCGHPAFTISNAHNNLGTMAVNAQSTSLYAVSMDASVSNNCYVPFYYTLSDGFRTYTDTIVVTVLSASSTPFEDNFESGNLANLPWTQGSQYGWQIATDDKFAGTYSAKSTNAGYSNTTAEMSVVGTCSVADSVVFYYKVSSENGYDKFHFYIDNTEKFSVSGYEDSEWTRVAYLVPAGTHTYKFTYSKDGSVDKESDCAWIDNIVLPHQINQNVYLSDTICAGGSYSYSGHNFATESLENGVHHLQATLSNGTSVYLTLTVGFDLQLNVADTTVTPGSAIVLRASGASRYEWSNGLHESAIVVAPSQTTTYTVTGYVNGCNLQRSATITVEGEGIADVLDTPVSIYPNPAAEVVNITSQNIKEVRLLNAVGQVVRTIVVNGDACQISLTHMPAGLYLVQVLHADGTASMHKLIRK